jgi:enoyl-CoA hydratase/3-hydroxyacyl-CoA dehydrogenase
LLFFFLPVLYSLKESYEEALRRSDVKAIVVTGKGGKFSGGFDISSFGGVQGGQSTLYFYLSLHYLTL